MCTDETGSAGCRHLEKPDEERDGEELHLLSGRDLEVVHISSAHVPLLRIKCLVPFINKGTFHLDGRACS